MLEGTHGHALRFRPPLTDVVSHFSSRVASRRQLQQSKLNMTIAGDAPEDFTDSVFEFLEARDRELLQVLQQHSP